MLGLKLNHISKRRPCRQIADYEHVFSIVFIAAIDFVQITAQNDIIQWSKNFVTDNVVILIEIALKFVPDDPIDNESALGQMMTWHWTGNKPLSAPMMA